MYPPAVLDSALGADEGQDPDQSMIRPNLLQLSSSKMHHIRSIGPYAHASQMLHTRVEQIANLGAPGFSFEFRPVSTFEFRRILNESPRWQFAPADHRRRWRSAGH